MKKTLMSIIVGLFIFSSTAGGIFFNTISAEDIVISTNTEVIEITYSFEKPIVSQVTLEDEIFSKISLSSCDNNLYPDAPAIPVKSTKILLPPHSRVKSIDVQGYNKKTISNVENIEIAPSTYYPLSNPDIEMDFAEFKKEISFDIDSEFETPSKLKYNPLKVYPDFHFIADNTDIQYKRGFPILTVDMFPVQYDDSTKTLTYYEDMDLQIYLENDLSIPVNSLFRGLPRDFEQVEKLVDNPSTMGSYQFINSQSQNSGSNLLTTQSSSPNGDMLIITTNALKNAPGPNNLQALAQAHESTQGIDVSIVTAESIYNQYNSEGPIESIWDDYGAYASQSDADAVREYIRDAYLNNNVDYVLLVGDDDWQWDWGFIMPMMYSNMWRTYNIQDNNEVPTYQLWVYSLVEQKHSKKPDPPSDVDLGWWDITTASDQPYACLDFPIKDVNECTKKYRNMPRENVPYLIWDNASLSDRLPEINVGRAPVEAVSDLQNFVKKTISYMSESHNSYNKVLMLGEKLGMGGVMKYAANCMNELIDGCSNHNYTTAGIPSDKYNIQKIYEKDGNWTKQQLISIINDGKINLLNHLGHANPKINMKLEWTDMSSLTNNQYFTVYSQGCYAGAFDWGASPCIAEHLTVKCSHGAVSGIWNTHFGWGARNSTDAPSQRYNREFIDALYGEDIQCVGAANQDSKEDVNRNYIHVLPLMKWLFYCITYFGDPALDIVKLHNQDNDFTLDISYNPADTGNVILNPSGGIYNAGTTIHLTANPIDGYDFDHWGGDLSGNENPVTITMNSDKTIVAYFTEEPVNEKPVVRYTYSPNDPNVDQTITFDAIASYDPDGDIVSYEWSYTTNDPLYTSIFMGTGITLDYSWSNPGIYSVTLEVVDNEGLENTDSKFIYVASNSYTKQYLLNITVNSPDRGIVSLDPDVSTYPENTEVTLTANANNGFHFDSWTGDVSGTDNPLTISMDGNKTIEAIFIENTVPDVLDISIDNPVNNSLYLGSVKIPFKLIEIPVVFGSLNVDVSFENSTGDVTYEIYMDDDLVDSNTTSENNVSLVWNEKSFFIHEIMITAVDDHETMVEKTQMVLVLNRV